MDIKTTFLHGDLEEYIYMKHLEGFIVKGKKELVYKLKNSLYGLKQSPRMWYKKFDMCIKQLGFVRSQVDHCVCRNKVGDHFIYIILYVDNMFGIHKDNKTMSELECIKDNILKGEEDTCRMKS